MDVASPTTPSILAFAMASMAALILSFLVTSVASTYFSFSMSLAALVFAIAIALVSSTLTIKASSIASASISLSSYSSSHSSAIIICKSSLGKVSVTFPFHLANPFRKASYMSSPSSFLKSSNSLYSLLACMLVEAISSSNS